MFGKLGDMMGKLQEMKQKADEIKIKLDSTILKCESGEISIEITGNRHIHAIAISNTLQHADKNELQEQLKSAINKAIAEADKINEAEMKKAASGMLPGL